MHTPDSQRLPGRRNAPSLRPGSRYSLLSPAKELHRPADRRLAWLLAAISLSLLPLMLVRLTVILLTDGRQSDVELSLYMVALALTVGAYCLSRTRRFRLAGPLLLATFGALPLGVMLTNGGLVRPEIMAQTLAWFLIPLLLGVVLLSWRGAVLTSLLFLVGSFGLPYLLSGITMEAVAAAAGLMATVAALIWTLRLNLHHLERDRRAALANSQEYLALALEAGQLGAWRWNIADGGIDWSGQAAMIAGLTDGEPMVTFERFLAAVHPEDRPSFDRFRRPSVAERTGDFPADEDDNYVFQFRFRRQDGQERWVEARGRIERDGQGNPTHQIGVIGDVTDRRLAEDLRHAYSDRLEEDVAAQTAALEEARHRAEQRAAQLSALNKLTEAVAAVVDLQTALATVASHLADLLSARQAAILLLNPPGDRLETGAIHGAAVDVYPDMISVANSPSAQRLIRHRRPMLLEKRALSAPADELYELGPEADGVPFLLLPLLVREEVLGLILLSGGPVSQGLTEPDMQLAQTATRQVAGIIEQHRLRAQEQAALSEAESANRAKSAFLARMSHELRTPLNAILGYSQVLARDVSLANHHGEALDIIRHSGAHILSLINDVLELSKIEAGSAQAIAATLDLGDLLKGLAPMFFLSAQRKGVSLELDAPASLPRSIISDEQKLRQALSNLLSHAVMVTDNGTVCLRVRQERRDGLEVWLRFEISDQGPGVAPEDLEALFQPFAQIGHDRPGLEGSGLGLAISRHYVRLLGGSLEVNNGDQGATFYFTIPVTLPEPSGRTAPTRAPRVVGLEPGQPDYRILIVEDQWESRLLLRQILDDLGLTLREATNGQEALEIWDQWQPHLILMDMRMPVLDGISATRAIRSKRAGEKTIIVALTASATAKENAVMMDAGCDDLILKPFEVNALCGCLEKHLGIRFRYAAANSAAGGVVAPRTPTLPEPASALPDQWRSELHLAASRARASEITELVSAIEPEHPALASALTGYLHRFRFDLLMDWAQPAEASHVESAG